MPPLSDSDFFRAALAEWYAREKRALPWRTEPSLYRTVISECMLQQTQVKTVLPYFERWMRRFPDFETLAAASADAVLKHWEGLGYYSRARNLHKLAKTYVILDPKPVTAEEWQTLPGIGPYTSAAISSIAHNQAAAVIDGNVVRILARLGNDERPFKNNGDAVKAFTPIARDLLDPTRPGDHNQAMMELGATVCVKHNPLCSRCPVADFCAGAAHGNPGRLPRIQRKATEKVAINRYWILSDGNILLHQIPSDASQLAGQFELPRDSHFVSLPPEAAILAVKTRSITHRRIRETILRASPAQLPEPAEDEGPRLHWIPLNSLDTLTLSGPHRRWIKELINSPQLPLSS